MDLEHIVYNTVGNIFLQYLTVKDLKILAQTDRLSREICDIELQHRMETFLQDCGEEYLKVMPLRSLVETCTLEELYAGVQRLYAKGGIKVLTFAIISMELNDSSLNVEILKVLEVEPYNLEQLILYASFRFNPEILRYLLNKLDPLARIAVYGISKECREIYNLRPKSLYERCMHRTTFRETFTLNTIFATMFGDYNPYLAYLEALFPNASIPLELVDEIFKVKPELSDTSLVDRLLKQLAY